MNALAVIKEASERGVRLGLNGGNLTFKAATKPPPELLAKLMEHKINIVSILKKEVCVSAWHPKPFPRIRCNPPFGLDRAPGRYQAAWQALLSQYPPGMKPAVWEAAIFDAATLFGDFGKLLEDYRWTPGNLFDVPHDGKQGGLAWFIKGSPVVAIGRAMAQCQDGRIWRRAAQ